jgi:RNA polymerase sigma-70 factor (ECF subfamily)
LNRKEYNQVVQLHSDNLFRYAVKLCGESHQAQDLVQDGFLKLWENRQKVPKDAGKAFLFRVVYNGMIDRYRKEKRMDYTDQLPVGKMYDQSIELEHRDLLELAFAQLPSLKRSILMLRDYEGYSYEEIGDIMSMNLSQVKVNIFRSRKKIKEIIDRLENELKRKRL